MVALATTLLGTQGAHTGLVAKMGAGSQVNKERARAREGNREGEKERERERRGTKNKGEEKKDARMHARTHVRMHACTQTPRAHTNTHTHTHTHNPHPGAQKSRNTERNASALERDNGWIDEGDIKAGRRTRPNQVCITFKSYVHVGGLGCIGFVLRICVSQPRKAKTII